MAVATHDVQRTVGIEQQIDAFASRQAVVAMLPLRAVSPAAGTNAAVTAASIALPPERMTSAAACVARGSLVATAAVTEFACTSRRWWT